MDAERDILAAVRASPKYAQVSDDLILRIAAQELAKRRSAKEALEATRNKLHQVAGLYQAPRMRYERWLAQLEAAQAQGSPDALRAACSEIMTYHTSTREREALLDAGFYTRIFEGLPPVRSVLDIACGLNPLCVPWMPLAPAAIYHALDVYADMASFLDRALDLLGIAHSTRVQDVLSGQPLPEVDLVFALKTIPCLEQVDKDAGSRLLATLRAGSVVISYPTRSVGGKNVGMAESYAERFATLTGGRPARRIDFDNEMVFVLHR